MSGQILNRWEATLRAIAEAEQLMAVRGYQAFPAWKRACRAARRLSRAARAARGLPPLPAVPQRSLLLAWGSGFLVGTVLAAVCGLLFFG